MSAEHQAELGSEPTACVDVAYVPPGLTPKEALELAALDAAVFRSASEKTLKRKINIVGKDGTVRPGVGRDVLRGLAKIQGLEHVVEEGARPKEVICTACGRPLKVKGNRGVIPQTCPNSYCQRTPCAGCSKDPSLTAWGVHYKRARKGKSGPWRCGLCTRAKLKADPEWQKRAKDRALATVRKRDSDPEKRERLSSEMRKRNADRAYQARCAAGTRRRYAEDPAQRARLSLGRAASRKCKKCGTPGHFAKTCIEASK